MYNNFISAKEDKERILNDVLRDIRLILEKLNWWKAKKNINSVPTTIPAIVVQI